MRIPLTLPVRKTAFLGGAMLAVLTFVALSIQQFVGFWITPSSRLKSVELASRIDPLNVYYDRLLGEHYLMHDAPKAAGYFEDGLRRDPHSARLWLELGTAYQLMGEPKKQSAAIREALVQAPKDVMVEWAAANLLLGAGDVPEGFRLMGEVAANDAAHRKVAMQAIFAVSGGNIATTLNALPATAEVRIQLLDWLLDSEKFPEADQVWPALLRSSGDYRAEQTFRYIDSLVQRHEAAKAASAWNDLLATHTDLRRRREPDNLLSNGGFEESFLQGGFGWRIRPLPGISVGEQSSVFHGGNQALEFQINASTLQDSGIYQMIPVQANSRYTVNAFIRAEELDSANGVRLVVSDYYTGAVLTRTEEVLGSTGWRENSGEFFTGSDTQLVKINIGRTPDTGLIRGRLWLDDVRLEKK
jgi:tetratricopeptide (TPR) repeat protein